MGCHTLYQPHLMHIPSMGRYTLEEEDHAVRLATVRT